MAKKKTHYIYSTLAASVIYTRHGAGGGDLPVEEGRVEIFGGANIPDKYMRTPEGAVITPVDEDELALLQADPTFKLHEKNGFIKISDKKVDGEVAAADMEQRDPSAPTVDQDYTGDDEGHGKPVLNSAPKPGRRA